MAAPSCFSKLLPGALALAALSIGSVRAQAPCEPLPRGVAGWWPGENTPDDLTLAANHGLLVGGTAFAPGVIGQAFEFDGIDDRLDVPDAPELRPTNFTLSAWIRLDDAGEWACIICKQWGNGSANSYSLWVDNGVLRGGMFGFTEALGTVLPVNKVLHTAVSYDGSTIRLYLDGDLIATAAGPASPTPYDANQVIIGAEDNGAGAYTAFFDGMIDEPQIFARALSACEIRSLYRARSARFCDGDADGDLVPDFEDNCPGISNAGQIDADLDGAGDPCDCAPMDPAAYSIEETYELTFKAKDVLDWCLDPTVTGPDTTYDLIRGGLVGLPVTGSTPECRSTCITPPPGLIGWWAGDGDATDLVGGHHGTAENGAGHADGWTLQAFRFDGVNDRIRTGSLSLGGTFSVAVWVNSDVANQGNYQRIVETYFGTQFALTSDNFGTGYKLIVNSPGSPYGLAQGGEILPGEWQHVVGTYDGATGKLYVDGRLVAMHSFPVPVAQSLPLNIGAYSGGGIGWAGLIDEVQLFDRALAEAEVQAMWEAGSAGQCKLAFGGTDAEWTHPGAGDAQTPVPAGAFWYLYRAKNTCGVGTYGYSSGGPERISAVCN